MVRFLSILKVYITTMHRVICSHSAEAEPEDDLILSSDVLDFLDTVEQQAPAQPPSAPPSQPPPPTSGALGPLRALNTNTSAATPRTGKPGSPKSPDTIPKRVVYTQAQIEAKKLKASIERKRRDALRRRQERSQAR